MSAVRTPSRAPSRPPGHPWRLVVAVALRPAVWWPVLAVALLAGLALWLVWQADVERARLQASADIRAQAEVVRSRLEARIASSTGPIEGIALLASSRGLPDAATLDALAETMIERDPLVRSLVVAPDLVIRSAHPLRGNEAAVGLDFRAEPVDAAALLAFDSNRMVLAGPIALRQGGVALSARVPYRIEDGESGLLGLVIDFPGLLEASGLAAFSRAHRFALRHMDAHGAPGAVFFGDATVEAAPHVAMEIRIPGGAWRWVVAVEEPVPAARMPSLKYGVPMALMLLLVVGVLSATRAWNAEIARIDPLSGLPNRRALFERLARIVQRRTEMAGRCRLVAIDLDGFKAVNDALGHEAGDHVIAAVGALLADAAAEGAWAARRSGDEFVLVLEEGEDALDADALLAKLPAQVGALTGQARGVTASHGAAVLAADDATPDQWLKRADEALYEAKRRRAR